jgi:hypothetical protein
MYLIIFSLVTPNEFVFPKHEQLESYVQQRGWEPVYRETCIEAGWLHTTQSEEELLKYFRPRLADGERATIFHFQSVPEVVPKFPDMEAFWGWATEHSYSQTDS